MGKKIKVSDRLKQLSPEFWDKHKGITNTELAIKLGVSNCSVWRARKGRDSVAVLGNRFENSYGKGSFNRLKLMLEDPLVSLNDTGKYFGFTRAQSSLYFISIYGRKRNGCFPRKKSDWVFTPKSRAYQVCLEAKEILDTFIVSDVVIVQRKYGFRLHVNGSVISAHRFHKSKTTPFMHTEQLNMDESIDYFFCFTEDRGYLIPREFVPVGGVTVHSVHTGGKYEPFLENWGVLKCCLTEKQLN